MPDPDMLTVSATQIPALFNVSQYATRWMMYKHFADGAPLETDENVRMKWGSLMQPLIIREAAEQLKMEVIPNDGDVYHRRGLLGCTRDATIICPDRGPGAMETKCVFDYRTWMNDWNGGRQPPKPHELQLQQQMLVGDEEPYEWGVIVAWLAGDLYFFERSPIEDLWPRLNAAAAEFFEDLKHRREPDPFGSPIELPWLTKMFPVIRGKTIEGGPDILKTAVAYRDARERQSTAEELAAPLRAQLLAYAKDAEIIDLPMGARVNIRPHGKGKVIKVFTPETMPADLLYAG